LPRAAVDDLVLRPATAADIAAVARCSRAAYGKYLARLGYEPKPMAADYRALAVDHALWVLSDGSACRGVLVLQDEADHLLIYSVAIDPAWQGRSLGRRLMAFAEDEARRSGLAELRLYTNAAMRENVAFYAALGYRETARRPHPRVAGSPLVFMSKALPAGPD